MINKLLGNSIVPVIEIDDPHRAKPLAEALLKGGIAIAEFTFRTNAAAAAIESVTRSFPEMVVGAGTLLHPDQVQRALDAGASFGLAPGLDADIVQIFHKAKVPFLPGVMTPSEIGQALALDCKLLKFFPAEPSGGVSLLKSMAAPYRNEHVLFCPTGGISPSNMAGYLALDIVPMVAGSWIATRKQIAEGAWEQITDQARDARVLCPAH